MATDQKIEDLLNLALDATEREREKSLELDVGYNPVDRTWDVIVKYTGSLADLERRLNERLGITGEGGASPIRVVELLNEYAILTLPESLIDYMASSPEIEYVEKPKRLFFSVDQGRAASCVNPLQTPEFNLKGEGVIAAVIDSGVDYAHPDFRNDDGSTRILAIWDQGARVRPRGTEDAGETGSGQESDQSRESDGEARAGQGTARERESEALPGREPTLPVPGPPRGFRIGVEYSQEMINEALAAPTAQERYQLVPERDLSGHGTAVLGIAAGNGRDSGGQYRGIAPESEILVVKLGLSEEGGFPRTTELMQAIDYVVRKSLEYQKPVAINLSFGNVYGPHDGSSLVETYLDDIANLGRSVIAVGTGNEGGTGGHTSGILENPLMGQRDITEIELGIADNELTVNLQIWKSYADQFEITLVHPSGVRLGPFQEILGPQRYRAENTELLVYYGEPSPYSTAQEIYIDFLPSDTYIDSGVWRILLRPVRITDGRFDMWLPSFNVLNYGTRFYRPTPETTLTIPSTARKVIAVGAYDSRLLSYASFSGRGYDRDSSQVKPDLAAPGVNIMAPSVRGNYAPFTGTSFATPFVTGAAAMLMQWGIVQGNDPYLYGEKVKAYLIRGARKLPGYDQWPNPMMGYGVLCVRDSIPG